MKREQETHFKDIPINEEFAFGDCFVGVQNFNNNVTLVGVTIMGCMSSVI